MGYVKYYASRQSLQIVGSMDFSLDSKIDFLQHGRCSDIGHSFENNSSWLSDHCQRSCELSSGFIYFHCPPHHGQTTNRVTLLKIIPGNYLTMVWVPFPVSTSIMVSVPKRYFLWQYFLGLRTTVMKFGLGKISAFREAIILSRERFRQEFEQWQTFQRLTRKRGDKKRNLRKTNSNHERRDELL